MPICIEPEFMALEVNRAVIATARFSRSLWGARSMHAL
jgi:hypothetical protein